MNKYLVFIFNVFNAYCNVTENWEVCNDKNLQDACNQAFSLPSVTKISVNIDLSSKGEREKVSRGKVSLKSNVIGGLVSVEYFLFDIEDLFKYLITYGADEEVSIIKFYACVLAEKGTGNKLTIGEFYSDDAYERVDGYFYLFTKNLRKRVSGDDEGVILFESDFNTFRYCVDTEYVFTSSDLKVEIVSYDDYKKQLENIYKATMERLKPLEGPKNIDHKSIPPVHSTTTLPVPRTSGSGSSGKSSGGVKTNDSCCHSCK